MQIGGEAVTPDNVVILSSVLFLVVIELCNSFEQADLEDKAIDPNFENSWGLQLGIFPVIHFVNHSILTIGFLITSQAFAQSLTGFLVLLALIYVVLMFILPFAEISNYESHIHTNFLETSFGYHIWCVIISTTSVFISIGGPHAIPDLATPLQLIGGSGIVVGVVLGPYYFLRGLQVEYLKRGILNVYEE